MRNVQKWHVFAQWITFYSSHALQYKEHLIKFVSYHSENKRCGICTLNITINSTPIWTWKRVVAIFSVETDFNYS